MTARTDLCLPPGLVADGPVLVLGDWRAVRVRGAKGLYVLPEGGMIGGWITQAKWADLERVMRKTEAKR